MATAANVNFPLIDSYVKRQEVDDLLFSVVAVTNKATGGSIGSAASTVDIASTININQTTAAQTLTLPSPTNTAINKSINVNNAGSTSFTLLSTVISPGAGIIAQWTGSSYSVIGTSSGATNVTVAGGKTFTVNNTLTLAGTDGVTINFPAVSGLTTATVTGTETLTNKTLTSPVLTTPTLGVATATSLNGLTVTTSTGTFTVTNGKTLAATNSLTLTGTDATVMTFPSTSATIARTDAANTFTGHQTIEGVTSTGATGTGAFVFATTPTLVTPVIGAATGTSLAVTAAITSSGATNGIGYATGAGGAVTQATDKTTGVTLNKASGAITTASASLAAAASVSFTLTNSVIAATDVVLVSIKSGAATGLYKVYCTATAAGSCQITLTNYGSTASEVVVINFVVFKAVAA